MKLEDIHIGDVLQVREWEDMAEEYGIDDNDNIRVPRGFTKCMRNFCGKIFTVSSIDEYEHIHSVEKMEGFYCISAEMLQPLPEVSEDNFEPVDLSGFFNVR